MNSVATTIELAAVGYLDGVRIRRALQAGIFRVMSRQEYLNKINVFPVPDGDTDTNLAFTLNAVLTGISGTVERHLGRFLAVVADTALTYRLIVGHCNCREAGERVLELLRESKPNLEGSWLMDGRTALGAHAGPGAIVVGLQEYQRPAGLEPASE